MVLRRSLFFVINRTVSSIVLIGWNILPLFHWGIILIKALIRILDNKGIHHTNWGWCCQLNASHCCNISFSLVSAVCSSLSRYLKLWFETWKISCSLFTSYFPRWWLHSWIVLKHHVISSMRLIPPSSCLHWRHLKLVMMNNASSNCISSSKVRSFHGTALIHHWFPTK
jgi:hypothetical protein